MMNPPDPSPPAEPTDASMMDSCSHLAQLLQETPPRTRCIDRVADALPDILQARQRKISWAAIAAALDMNRCTLINAVKTLTARSAERGHALVFPQDRPAAVAPAFGPASPPEPAQADKVWAGVTPVGRARIEQFNL